MKDYLNYKVLVYPKGSKFWYLGGKLHREDGPACECPDGDNWYLNGQLHREDGPAIEYPDNGGSWYLNGKKYTEDEHKAEMERRRATCYEVKVLDAGGNKFWYLGGERHREDGPACEWADGYNSWYLNGREYTEDGHTYQMARRQATYINYARSDSQQQQRIIK